MRSFLKQRSVRRQVWMGCALVTALAAGVVLGMAFTTTTEAAQAARTFNTSSGMVLNYVNPGSTADFEGIMQKLGEALRTSENSQRQQQADGWKVYKAREPGPGNSVLYVWFIDPTISGADYAVSQILNEAFPAEVQGLYETFNGSFAAGGGQAMVNLELVTAF